MRKNAIYIVVLSLITFLCGLLFIWDLSIVSEGAITHTENPKLKDFGVDFEHPFSYELKLPSGYLRFNLTDPQQAPESIRDKVMLGWNILRRSREYAKEFVGNELSCTNCHFNSGNTFGSRNGSISLVGAPDWFPSFSKRLQKTLTLEDRISNCFQRSLNGKALPNNSKEMQAIISYLEWISHEVKGVQDIPWRGLIPLKTSHKPNSQNGQKVYMNFCAACHQPDGSGNIREDIPIPPLWGEGSYNDGAGMNQLNTVSSFIYWNMPFQQPAFLTQEQAMDVAQFLIDQKRPILEPILNPDKVPY